jgi:GNAT superfamily N-acetyltransferase
VAPNDGLPIEIMVANLRGWLPLFEQLEGARLEHGGGYSRWTSAIRLPFFNGVLGVPEGEDLDRAIDRVLAPFDEGDIPLLWIAPLRADLTALLEARGFRVERIPGMAIDLSSLPVRPPPQGASIGEVDHDDEALLAATTIALTTNGFPASAAPPFVAALGRFPERAKVHTLLAAVDGVPASTGTLFEWGGVSGLYNVGTSEAFRGRGLGGFVSLVALEAARAAGHRVCVLQASSMAEPIYRGLGFEETCRFAFAVRLAQGMAK